MKTSYKNVKETLSPLNRVMIGFMYILQYYTSVVLAFVCYILLLLPPKLIPKGQHDPCWLFGINFGGKNKFLGVL